MGLPLGAQVFQALGAGQFLGDDKRPQTRGIPAPEPECDGRHGLDAKLLQTIQCRPFVARSQNGDLALQKVLDDLDPSDAMMNLDVVPPAIQAKSQSPAVLDCPKHVSLEGLDLLERIQTLPDLSKCIVQVQLHVSFTVVR
jgi:hypothetical protein